MCVLSTALLLDCVHIESKASSRPFSILHFLLFQAFMTLGHCVLTSFPTTFPGASSQNSLLEPSQGGERERKRGRERGGRERRGREGKGRGEREGRKGGEKGRGRKGEGEKERKKQREKKRERKRERESKTERESKREREKERRKREREKERETKRCARLNDGHLTRCGAHTPDFCARPMSTKQLCTLVRSNLKTALRSLQ